MEQKKYFDELNIFRALVIIWVTIGHSFDAGQNVLGFLHGYAYTFHMYAFMLLSGLLFASKFNRCDSIKAGLMIIIERAKRLLVPYLFFTAVSYILKMFLEKYANNKLSNNIVLDILLGQNNPNGGIWFLYALFIISAFAIILKWLNKYVLLALSTALFIISFYVEIRFVPLSSICKYFVFFMLGIILKSNYSKLSEKAMSIKRSLLYSATAIITIISFAISYICLYVVNNVWLNVFVCFLNIIDWYFIALAVNSINSLKKPTMIVGNYGMDIYMLGYYVQIAIRVVLGSMLGLPYIIYSILMCVLGLILPIPISKFIVRKIRIFRALMLGDFSKKRD